MPNSVESVSIPAEERIAATDAGDDIELGLGTTVLERFWNQVATQPGKPALVSNDGTYTYGEMSRRVVATAEAFSELGVGPGDRVVLLRERDGDAVVTIMALLHCGAAYVPVDLRSPASRIAGIVHEADPAYIVVSPSAADLAEQVLGDADVILVPILDAMVADKLRQRVERGAPAESSCEAPLVSPDALSYIIYTSGSTGTPKGVPITNRNLSHLLTAWDGVMLGTHNTIPAIAPPRDNNHRSLLLSSLSFDASVAELFWPLVSGGTLVVAPDPAHAAFEVPLGELIIRHNVTHMQCTPTRATLMLSDDDDRAALGSIAHLVIGGEALPTALARKLLQAGIGRLTNAYGPTEATVWATACDVTNDLVNESSSIVPVGSSLAGVWTTVLAESGVPARTDEVGELIVGGPFTSAGYFRNPELSAKSFGRFEFGGRLLHGYRTGDLVSKRSDGLLDFHGRMDHQVKIRGHRIELGEIEAILASDATVSHAAVCVDPNRPNELVAFVVPSDGHCIDPASLGNRMRRRLPEVMIPRRYVVVDGLPKTTSEKIDRTQLSRQLLPTETRGALKESRDPLADMITDFSFVLDRDSVEADGDFFDLGGHSLISVELVARIEDRTGVRLPIRTILKAPTPRTLAALVEDSRQQNLVPGSGPGSRNYANLLVRFNRTSEQKSVRKLYLVHGASGNVVRFHGVARAMTDIVELVGIQAAGLEGNEVPDENLESMVMRYADLIEKDNPGPTVELGGFSFGGLIAIHLGAELFFRGKTVRSLVLLDSFESNEVPSSVCGKLTALFENARHRNGLSILEFTRAAMEGWVRRSDWDRAGTEAALAMGYHDLFDHNVTLLRTAPPAPLVDAPALLLRSAVENPFRTRTYEQCMNSPSETTQVWIPAKHDELFARGTLDQVNDAIRAFLRRC